MQNDIANAQPDLTWLKNHARGCQEAILSGFKIIKETHGHIYENKKKFYEDWDRYKVKYEKIKGLISKLKEDCFVLQVPGKFPSAYIGCINELNRRKLYNYAVMDIAERLQRTFKAERKKRQSFNNKNERYLPVSIR